MATAHGPGWAAADASPVHSLQHSSRHLAPMDPAGPASLAREPPIHADVPPPNPPFVFPARLPSTSSVPPTFSRASGRRPMSAIEPREESPSPSPENGDRPRRPVALPAFTFNPGASLSPDPNLLTLASPPITPNSSSRLVPLPSRPGRHGHHRGGSEFVGGSIRDGNSIAVTSISPTKSDSGFASSGLAPPRSHRRGISGAISTSDLPFLHPLPDLAMPKGSSAPNTPTAFELREGISIPAHDQLPGLPEPARPFEPNRRPGGAALDANVTIEPATPSPDAESSILGQARPGRARVGFSDKLEFIPRPLSLVSSDTSSTATARPGHSVSGSISSVMSAASQGGRGSPAPLSRTSTRGLFDYRPSTAGPILERTANLDVGSSLSTSPRRRNSIPTLLAIADEQSVGEADAPMAKFLKRWSFFGLEPPFMGSTQRPSSRSSSESVSRAVSGASSSDHESDSTETGKSAPASAKKTGKKTSRKKKVKGWAGSILPRKPRGYKKRHKVDEVRPPTPPSSVGHWDDVEDGEVADTEGSGAELAAPEVAMAKSPKTALDLFNQRPRSRDDASYPMIDLDAALGPFNTPVPQNPEWEAAQRAAGNPGKRRMHSAQGMKGFSGPGMHYHRRAESAPDLPPFDPGRSGIHRFSSNSTMADVFEEDEEDDDVALGPNQHNRHDAAAVARFLDNNGSDEGEATPPAMVSPTESRVLSGSSSDMALGGLRRTNSGPSEADKAALHSVRAECSMALLQGEVIVEEPPSIIYRSANMLRSGPDSAASSPKRLAGTKELSPVEVGVAYMGNAGGVPISPYSVSHASSHPSPRSPMSVDAQRISAASSITDKNNFQSLLMGEPGPEVRISVDYDIRSLTSSNSTMTRDSTFMSNPRLSQPSLREQRPVSVSAAFGRRRASLVSLSRLISSSHGERSKLSMELTLDEADSKKSRSMGSKAKQRLGRMMQFWKPSKEGAPT